MAELKRIDGHIAPDQEWHVKCTEGTTVYIKMGGGSNSFAQKHILAPSKKEGVDDDTKLLRRLWHRVDKAGTHEDNPSKGAKVTGKGIMSRGDKYGSALSMKTRSGNVKDKGDVKNSAICLSLLDLDTVLVDIAKALIAWGGTGTGKVDVKFSKACVKTVDLAGHVTGPVDTVKIEVHKLEGGYEITHLIT